MPKITEVYAFISTDEGPGDEGIVAMKAGDSWVPMVGADQERIESLKPIARTIGRIACKRVILTKFSLREDLEEIN